MLKGKMKIELTDINTGEAETIVEQNMVTSALTNIFKPLGLAKSPTKLLYNYVPHYQYLLGGILLFDTPLDENVNNLYAPASAKLVGCGSYEAQNNTKGTLRGGFNTNESEINLESRFAKYVYDYSTSQANGTIASVCLTHKNGGYNSYGGKDAEYVNSIDLAIQIDDGTNQYVGSQYTGTNSGDRSSGVSVGLSELLFLIDHENDCAYYVRIDSVRKITIIRRKAYLKSVSIIENPYSQKPFIDERIIEFSNDMSSTNYLTFNFDHYDNCLYLISSGSSNVDVNGKFTVTKIDIVNWNSTHYDMVNTSDITISVGSNRSSIVHQGFVFCKCSYASPYDLYKFELGNSANVNKMKHVGENSFAGIAAFAINGIVYYEYGTYNSGTFLYTVNSHTNEIMKPENKKLAAQSNSIPSYTPILNEPMLWYVSSGSSGSGFYLMANYLATINNLTEPVTKTADKTMKITYIIQEQ